MNRVFHKLRHTSVYFSNVTPIKNLSSKSKTPKILVASVLLSSYATKDVLNEYANYYLKDLSNINLKSWMCKSVSDVDTLQKNLDKDFFLRMEGLCMQLQGNLCREIEKIDKKQKFIVDKWNRANNEGGGISCVIAEGDVFEKGGINITSMNFKPNKNMILNMRSRLNDTNISEDKEYTGKAVGISCVLHPKNPHVPTVHFNYRYFELDYADGSEGGHVWWFGGGTDLTPYYLDEADCSHFHQMLKNACDAHDQTYYPKYKKWCDDYFVNTHRGERRGVGGIFFDDFIKDSKEEAFNFVKSCAESVPPSYLPIVQKHKDDKFTDEEREWQLIRRGRYVEFNLVHDRGTKFGLVTPNARIESILMSLPNVAKWEYCHDHTKDPRHVKLIDVLKNPKEWLQKQ